MPFTTACSGGGTDHDLPPTLEGLEQRIKDLEEVVAGKHHIPRPPEPVEKKKGLLD
jgi:hypothetical protein